MKLEKKKIAFNEALLEALDGRRNKWLSEKTGISLGQVSLIITGRLIPSDKQVEKIKTIFPNLSYDK